MHFNRYIHYWTGRKPAETVLVCEERSLTWARLDRESGALAAYLADIGVGPGDRIGILLGNCLEWCVGFVACIRLGAILVPLNPNFGRFELTQIERDAGCAAVLSSHAQMEKLGGPRDQADGGAPRIFDRRGANPPMSYDEIIAEGRPFADRAFSDSDPLAICYTSGTTGVPKGAVLTHRAVETMVFGLSLDSGWRAGEERFLILAPLAFTGGVICLLAPVLAIGSLGYIEKTVEPHRALKLLIDHQITYFGGVPSLWERIAAAPEFATADLSCLRATTTGGAPVSRALMDVFAAKGVIIRQSYGCTEACGGVSAPTKAAALARPEACGYALPGLDFEIRNDQGELVRPGEIGEIRVRGAQVMTGYWNNPEATAAAFDGEWYMTGDLGTLTEDGAIIVKDRKKNMLISGGVNVYPAEVERAMAEIPGVAEVVVLGVPSARWGQEVAAIVYAPASDDSPAGIIAKTRDLVGAYKAPKHVVVSPKPLPRTASGKIARTGLGELFETLGGTA